MKAREWKTKVKECDESGITAMAWCKSKGISYQTYLRWAKKFREEESEKRSEEQDSNLQWAKIDSVAEKCEVNKIIKSKDVRNEASVKLTIVVGEGLRGNQVAELLRVVKEACC